MGFSNLVNPISQLNFNNRIKERISMDLKNRIVLVTGGSLGIGLATAKLFKQKGSRVIITGRNKERLQKAAEENQIDYYVSDVSIEDDVVKLFDNIKKDFGNIDVLINNA